jgi:hypothetical protein
VVTTILPTADTSVVMVNAIEHKVLALAVWSTGDVTPIFVAGHGHIRTLSPDETWHFAI